MEGAGVKRVGHGPDCPCPDPLLGGLSLPSCATARLEHGKVEGEGSTCRVELGPFARALNFLGRGHHADAFMAAPRCMNRATEHEYPTLGALRELPTDRRVPSREELQPVESRARQAKDGVAFNCHGIRAMNGLAAPDARCCTLEDEDAGFRVPSTVGAGCGGSVLCHSFVIV